jgi:hypothetical protein
MFYFKLFIEGLKDDVTAFTVHQDKYFNRTFISCLKNTTVPTELWIPGQPDNKGGIQACARVNICSKNKCAQPGFSNIDCSLVDRSLCQIDFIPDTSSITSTTKQSVPISRGFYSAKSLKLLKVNSDCSSRVSMCKPKVNVFTSLICFSNIYFLNMRKIREFTTYQFADPLLKNIAKILTKILQELQSFIRLFKIIVNLLPNLA